MHQKITYFYEVLAADLGRGSLWMQILSKQGQLVFKWHWRVKYVELTLSLSALSQVKDLNLFAQKVARDLTQRILQ